MITLFVFFVFLFMAYIERKSIFSSFLFFIFSLSFLATFLLSLYETTYIETSAVLYLLFFFIPFFICFNRLKMSSRKTLCLSKEIKIFANIFMVFSIPAVPFYGYYTIQTLLFTDLSNVRNTGEFLLPSNFLNTIFSFFSSLYFVPLLLYFYFLKEDLMSNKRILLIISSLSFPLLTLCYAGRDGVLFWGMNFVVFYLFFKDSIENKIELRKIVKIVVIVILLFLLLFLLISSARFSDSDEGTFYSIVSYIGQQTSNFSQRFNNDFFEGKGSLFPGLKSILGISQQTNEDRFYEYRLYGLEEQYNVFAFFASTIVNGYGKLAAFLIAILFFLIVRHYILLYQKNGSVLDLLLVVMFFQIPMNGVFYYRQGIANEDVTYLILWIMILILKRIKI